MVFNGTCAAFFVYSGGPAAANAALVAAFYRGSFHWLADATLALPALAFDLTALSAASVQSALTAVFEATVFDSAHYLQAAENMTALNFLVSLVRPLISASTSFLSMVGCTRAKTADLGICNTTGGAQSGDSHGGDGAHEFDNLRDAVQAILGGHADHIERTGTGVRVRKLTEKAVANPISSDVAAKNNTASI